MPRRCPRPRAYGTGTVRCVPSRPVWSTSWHFATDVLAQICELVARSRTRRAPTRSSTRVLRASSAIDDLATLDADAPRRAPRSRTGSSARTARAGDRSSACTRRRRAEADAPHTLIDSSSTTCRSSSTRSRWRSTATTSACTSSCTRSSTCDAPTTATLRRRRATDGEPRPHDGAVRESWMHVEVDRETSRRDPRRGARRRSNASSATCAPRPATG